MTTLSKQVALPLLAVNTAWELAEIGEPHPILGIADVWVAEENAKTFEDAVFAALAKAGVADGNNIAPEFTATLRMIATAGDEYYAWVSNVGANDNGAVLLATLDGDAILIARDEETVLFQPIEADRPAERFVDALIEAEPADIKPLSVPKSEFSTEVGEANDSDDEFSFEWEGDGDDTVDPAVRLKELMLAKRALVQQIYTAKRVGGRRVRCGPYSAIDIVGQGRVLTFLDSSRGAEPVIQCLPGAKSTIAEMLRNANDALA